MDSAYRVCSPPFTHQTIDSEVVLVNLATGYYYSLRGTAALLWSWLESGNSRSTLIERLAQACQVASAKVEAGVLDWLQQLEGEGIVQQVPVAAIPLNAAAPPTHVPSTHAMEFAAPILEKFTDMRELLLLDPIHEVTELGWPHARPEAA